MLTAARVREVLHYDPITGVFVWRVTLSKRAVAGTAAGRPQKSGYGAISVDHHLMPAHRLAWLYVTGEIPSGQIDHIDGVRSNNRFANLRLASQAINSQNLHRAKASNRTGLLGVAPNRRGFMAQITVNRKCRHLGTFKTPEEAHQAYLEAKRKLHPGNTL